MNDKIIGYRDGRRVFLKIDDIAKAAADAIDVSSTVNSYLTVHPVTGITINEVKSDGDIQAALRDAHAPGSDNQDLSSYVKGDDGRLSDARTPKTHTHPYEPTNANIQSHVSSAHAPSNAQKNSDITQAEIEAKLTGAIASHSHDQLAWLSPYRTILDSSGSLTAAKTANTYGMGQGDPVAVTGTGTLYPLNTIYIAAADYPTINSLSAKLRIRAVIECNDAAPFTGTFKIGLHPVTRPATSGGAGLCIYTIGSPVTGSQATGTNLGADSQNSLVGADFALPADGFYVLAVVTSGTMATSSHVHISASLQIHNA
jgi:hypothetical protein